MKGFQDFRILEVRKVDFAQRFIGVLYTLGLKCFPAERFFWESHRECFCRKTFREIFQAGNALKAFRDLRILEVRNVHFAQRFRGVLCVLRIP